MDNEPRSESTDGAERALQRRRHVSGGVCAPIRTASDLATVVSTVRARAAAGRITPEATLAAADDLGIEVHGSDDGVEIRQA